MEKRTDRDRLFCRAVRLMTALALLLVVWPILRLTMDAATVYLRSWGVLPGIGEVFWRTVWLVVMVLLIVLPLTALITLWMVVRHKSIVARRVRQAIEWFSHLPAVFIGLLGFFLIGGNPYLHDRLLGMALFLAFMFLPFAVYRMDEVLRRLPPEYVMAGQALGGKPMAVLFQIQIPQVRYQIYRVLLRLTEKVLSEATALLVLFGAVMPNQVLATELFRLAWLGRRDAAALAFGLLVATVAIRGVTASRWKREEGENRWHYNWW